jgi:hypothetical protein
MRAFDNLAERPTLAAHPLARARTRLAGLTGLWLALRLLTGAAAAIFAMLLPLDPTRAVGWPPDGPLGAWLHWLLVEPWVRWDVNFYVWIVERGYRADDGTAQFHPLLAWLATPVAWLVGSPALALLLVASAASLALVLAFEGLARLDLDERDARGAVLLLMFWPPAFILFAPYTEGLFLLCAVGCLLWARRRRWWLAGLAGALATLTRQQGVFLLLPLAWELWAARGQGSGVRDQGADRSSSLVAHRPSPIVHWASLALIPAGLLVWLVYRAVALGDLRANLSDPQALIFSLLISPSSAKVVPVQAFLLPLHALWLALSKFARAPEVVLAIDLFFGFLFLAMTALAWRRLCASYRIYTVAIILVSFGYYTGPFYPYMGLPRHLLLAFPVFISLAPRVRAPRARLLVVALGLAGALFLLLMYEIHGWVP